MLEFVLVYFLAKKNGEKAIERGRKPTWFKVATWLLWFGFETLGFIFGALVLGEGISIYLFALIGAGIGGAIAYVIASNCNQGDYVLPQFRMQQAAQMLQAPCILTIRREDFEQGAQVLNVTLNKQFVGAIQNGQSLTAQTMYWNNEILVAAADALIWQPQYFALVPGQAPVICISGNTINVAASTGISVAVFHGASGMQR